MGALFVAHEEVRTLASRTAATVALEVVIAVVLGELETVETDVRVHAAVNAAAKSCFYAVVVLLAIYGYAGATGQRQ